MHRGPPRSPIGVLLFTLALAFAALPGPARAQDQFREVKLVDGRSFRGEVVGTSGAGMRLRIPAGVIEVAFDDVAEVLPIDPVAAAQGTVPRVALIRTSGPESDADVREAVARMVRDTFAAFAGLTVIAPEAISTDILDQADACRHDPACLGRVGSGLSVDHVIAPSVEVSEAGRLGLRLSAVLVPAKRVTASDRIDFARDGLSALAQALPGSAARALQIMPDRFPAPPAVPVLAPSPVPEVPPSPPGAASPEAVPPPAPAAPEPAPAAAEAAPAAPEPAPAAAEAAPAAPEPAPAAPEPAPAAAEPAPTAPEPAPTAAEPAPAAAEPSPAAPGEPNAVAPSADEPRASEAVPPEEPPPPPGGEEPEGGDEPAAPGSSGGEIGGVGATTQAATVVPPGRPKTVGTLIALGFLPLPGMGNVYLADKPGFVANLLVNIAQGWAVVYTVGLHAESARQMVSRSILIPYGIAVLVNQVTGAVGWARHRKGAAPGVAVAPGIEDGRLDGVRLSLGGTF